MSAERTHAVINPIYHQVYGVLQQFKFLGAWNRCLDQHSAAIREHFFPNKNISVLYCGTATKRNPIDVMAFMKNVGMSPNITTIDLSGKPIDPLDRHEFSPVQANCKSLPFADKSFDYITTDFLLS
ncbi:hypothetical protein HZA75_08050, partial [Candidatus Roizmanbacteria bacterium]|nr:hypothetical protein [Candidatus Roizmanbacteria bacterium]